MDDLVGRDHARVREPLLELARSCARACICSFFASSYSAFSAMSPNSRAMRIRSATSRRLSPRRTSSSCLQLLVALGGEDHFLHSGPPESPERERRRRARHADAHGIDGGRVPQAVLGRTTAAATIPGRCIDLRAALVDRRRRDPDAARARADGGRQRPGVPAPGPPLRRRPRLLGDGQLRGARAPQRAHARLPAHRLATSTRSRCRSSARTRRRWPRPRAWSRPPGADIVDINFGCPVRKVTKTGAGAYAARRPRASPRGIVARGRRGRRRAGDGEAAARRRATARATASTLGPRLVEAGAAALTLHPRSAQQMYTGTADHALTAELVDLVDVPVDRLRRHHVARQGAGGARRRPGAAAVMVGARRPGQPVGAARRSSTAPPREPTREEIVGRARALRARGRARARRARATASCRSSTAGTWAAAGSRGRSSRSSCSCEDDRRGRAAAARAPAPARCRWSEQIEPRHRRARSDRGRRAARPADLDLRRRDRRLVPARCLTLSDRDPARDQAHRGAACGRRRCAHATCSPRIRPRTGAA